MFGRKRRDKHYISVVEATQSSFEKRLNRKNAQIKELEEKYAESRMKISELERSKSRYMDESIRNGIELNRYKKMIRDGKLKWDPEFDKEHYHPGDTVVFKRLYNIDIGNPYGLETIDAYRRLTDFMIDMDTFYAEMPRFNDYHNESYVLVDNIIGNVIEYDETTVTVNLRSEYSMAEPGKALLSRFTKKDISERIRIAHRTISEKEDGKIKVKRIISCYLVESSHDYVKRSCNQGGKNERI